MDDLGCPAAAENKRAHKEFLATFTKLHERFQEQGASPTLVLEISDTVTKWLIDHISKIDTQLNACVANV